MNEGSLAPEFPDPAAEWKNKNSFGADFEAASEPRFRAVSAPKQRIASLIC